MPNIDLSKVSKLLSKNNEGLTVGFYEPIHWLSTGCYALNWMLTKDFNKGLPLDGKINMFAGESGAGKSYICSANGIRDALSKGMQVVLIDTEDRITPKWMKNLDVDPENPNLIRYQTNSIETVMEIVATIAHEYREANKDIPREEQNGMLIVIDSLGALYPDDEVMRYSEGELSMTDGMRRAGALTRMTNSILNSIASTTIGCNMTNHVYSTTDMYSDDMIPGGKKTVFLSTQIVQMNKLKLKAKDLENADDEAKDSDVVGIRSKCKIYKSNWNKTNETIEVQIPYKTGMNPYSGLFDLFSSIKGDKDFILNKDGVQYTYNHPKTGEVVWKKYRKNITNEDYDQMMKDYTDYQNGKEAEEKAELLGETPKKKIKKGE